MSRSPDISDASPLADTVAQINGLDEQEQARLSTERLRRQNVHEINGLLDEVEELNLQSAKISEAIDIVDRAKRLRDQNARHLPWPEKFMSLVALENYLLDDMMEEISPTQSCDDDEDELRDPMPEQILGKTAVDRSVILSTSDYPFQTTNPRNMAPMPTPEDVLSQAQLKDFLRRTQPNAVSATFSTLVG